MRDEEKTNIPILLVSKNSGKRVLPEESVVGKGLDKPHPDTDRFGPSHFGLDPNVILFQTKGNSQHQFLPNPGFITVGRLNQGATHSQIAHMAGI
jgi:hypothetical protein